MDDITPFLPGDTVAFLRIADENRRFPFRPIAAGLFLIGKGVSCDLRLGHDEMPALHSVLQINGSLAEIHCVAEYPRMFVNGEAIRQARLSDGALIEIGDVRLVFQLCRDIVLDSDQALPLVHSDPVELVANLESELALIDSLQLSGSERIHQLLKAAHDAVDGLELARTIRFSDFSGADSEGPSAANAPDAAMMLSRFKTQESRLSDVCQVLEQVVRQQQMIARAMQCLVDRIEELKATPAQPGSLRASA